MSAETRTAHFEGRPGGSRQNWFTSLFGAVAESGHPHRWGPEHEHTWRDSRSEPLHLLAEGDAFSFRVYVTYDWRGHAVSREELQGYAELLGARARKIATLRLRPIARDFPPHRARQLEERINKETGDNWQRLTDGERQFWFAMTVRAEPDEEVVAHMRPYWAERIKVECDHELGLQRARQADKLTRIWSDIFERLESDPRATHAAKLTEEEFARVFGDFVGTRRQAVQDLLELLRTAVKGHQDVGLGPSEFTSAWDEAIKAFQKQHGLKPTDPE